MSSAQFQEHLASDERVTAADSATLVDGSTREAVAVGTTDRRLLCTSEAGTFVSLWYDHVCSVRSRRRTRTTWRGTDCRLLLAVGGLLATLAFVGLLALAEGAVVPLLALAAAGGIAAAHHLWPSGAEFDVDEMVGYANARLAEFDGNEPIGTIRQRIIDDVDDRHRAAGAGLLAALAFVSVVAVGQSFLAPVLAAVLVGGVALARFAYANRDEFAGLERVRHRDRLVRIDTADGRTVRLRIDPEVELDREFARLASAGSTTADRPRSSPVEAVTELDGE